MSIGLTSAVQAGDDEAAARCRQRVRIPLHLAGALFVAFGLESPSSGQFEASQIYQSQVNSARRMIELAVEQGIASLPPPTGQSFSYEYDPEQDTYVKSTRLGPSAFRSPQPVGPGAFSVRLATSYFHLSQSFAPIDYQITDFLGSGFTRFGLDAHANVTVVNLAANYGVTNRVELRINLPVVVVDAGAQAIYSALPHDPGMPPKVQYVAGDDPSVLNSSYCTEPHQSNCLVYHNESFSNLGVDAFHQGTNVGVGRISTGAKALVYKNPLVTFAVEPELLFPSPNEGELAGAGSFAIVPRGVGAFTITDQLRFYADIGYDYDFDNGELSHLVWNSGLSFATRWVAIDAGVGGAEYQDAIQWTPNAAPVSGTPYQFTKVPGQDNTLGTSFTNILLGLKFALRERIALSGDVVVPVTGTEFQPSVIGTLAIEAGF